MNLSIFPFVGKGGAMVTNVLEGLLAVEKLIGYGFITSMMKAYISSLAILHEVHKMLRNPSRLIINAIR